MKSPKSLAKRSKWLVCAATVAKDVRAGLAARSGPVTSTCGSTHEPLHTSASLAYIDSVFEDYLRYGSLDEEDLRGARVLELGPGDNFGVAMRFIAAGAERVTTLDKFVSRRDDEQQRVIYAAQGERLVDGADGLDRSRLEPIEGVAVEDADDRLAGETFDLIVSRAVLEHLFDLDRAFDAMDSLLAPGGLMLHKVDFRDHGMFTDGGMHPLTFLTVPDGLYAWMSRHSGRPNRHLADWYREKLEEFGYEARYLVTHEVGAETEIEPHAENWRPGPEAVDLVAAIRPRLAPGFRSLSDADLAASGAYIVARKPG